MSQDILDYLELHNRPFSANEVIQSVGKNKDLTKAQILKGLDKLVAQGRIIDKIYNKQKIYCIAQEHISDPQAFEEELKQLDRNITDTQTKIKEDQEKIMIGSTKCKEMQGRMSMAEATKLLSDIEKEMVELTVSINKLSEDREEISEKDRQTVYEEHEKLLKEYRKRKRICMDILDAILEGYPKSKQHLYEDVGIELDDNSNFNLKHPI